MRSRWEKILVTDQTSIRHALEVLDREALRLVIVVDSSNVLLGVITDGDIRRGILKGISIDANVSKVMNTKPHKGYNGSSDSDLVRDMEYLDILSMPIVDKNDCIVGLFRLQDVLEIKKYDNPVFLMAGGFGTRLRPLTDNCPKPLLKVGDKPILEIVLLQFIKSGFSNFYISTHYLPEMIREYFGNGEKWNVSINYIYEDKPLGTGGALGLLPKDLPDLPIIMMNGDVLTKVNIEKLLAFHNEHNASATVCVREYKYQVPFGVIESKGHNIKSMVEKPIQRFHVNAGIYVVNRTIIKQVKNNEIIDMPTLLERHLNNKVLMFPFYEYWLDIGHMDDFKKSQIDIVTLGL